MTSGKRRQGKITNKWIHHLQSITEAEYLKFREFQNEQQKQFQQKMNTPSGTAALVSADNKKTHTLFKPTQDYKLQEKRSNNTNHTSKDYIKMIIRHCQQQHLRQYIITGPHESITEDELKVAFTFNLTFTGSSVVTPKPRVDTFLSFERRQTTHLRVFLIVTTCCWWSPISQRCAAIRERDEVQWHWNTFVDSIDAPKLSETIAYDSFCYFSQDQFPSAVQMYFKLIQQQHSYKYNGMPTICSILHRISLNLSSGASTSPFIWLYYSIATGFLLSLSLTSGVLCKVDVNKAILFFFGTYEISIASSWT